MKKICWLHISDIHFYPSSEWRDSPTRDGLLKTISEQIRNTPDLRPDFVFCTGDIAFGETSKAPLTAQYSEAKQFFSKLCAAIGNGMSMDRIFPIPGNHDVNRRSINTDAQATLVAMAKSAEDNVEKINQRYNDLSKEYVEANGRLAEYQAFIGENFPHITHQKHRNTYTWSGQVNSVRVGICGLDSTWSCAGDEDDRNLWMAAQWQLNAALESTTNVELRIGLMHHPVDWLNIAERRLLTQRIPSTFDFLLHGHTHDQWVTTTDRCTTISAGAVGAHNSEEFGFNFVVCDLESGEADIHLYSKRHLSNGWTICPIPDQAPKGVWRTKLPIRKNSGQISGSEAQTTLAEARAAIKSENDYTERRLSRLLDRALTAYPGQPRVWVTPILRRSPETSSREEEQEAVQINELLEAPQTSFVLRAPPQYGLTCLAHHLALEAWRRRRLVWLYLDCDAIKPNKAAVVEAIEDHLKDIGRAAGEIECFVLDSWCRREKDHQKILRILTDEFSNHKILLLERLAPGMPDVEPRQPIEITRLFEEVFLWSMGRSEIRGIVNSYNNLKYVGEENAVTTRVSADLEVLNLHRTPLNCLTLLKASELEFDESPVNRSEVIRRVLYILFNSEDIPSYKSRPDLKDCEFILGYFCELILREGQSHFSRDRFLREVQAFCRDRLIRIETHVLFDILHKNNIIVESRGLYAFRFSYWVLYFGAHRMHQDVEFAKYVLQDTNYTRFPEIIEFYTGIDRRRNDALEVILNDLERVAGYIRTKCGLPPEFNPFKADTWISSEKSISAMEKEIEEGVLESNLSQEVKDRFADRSYDVSRPYNQELADLVGGENLWKMIQCARSASRALRNSDYVDPALKRKVLTAILSSWLELTNILLIVLPDLARNRCANYDNVRFFLSTDFSGDVRELAFRILQEIPANVSALFSDDLYSPKMAPLLFDAFDNHGGAIVKHELALLILSRRPLGWQEAIQSYIASVSRNSFYLQDIYHALRTAYRYGYLSAKAAIDVEHLLKVCMTKHVTGAKDPGPKAIGKVKFPDKFLPERKPPSNE